VERRYNNGDQPDVERELNVRDDRTSGVLTVCGDVEPDGDGDGNLRRTDQHDERDDHRRAGDSPGAGDGPGGDAEQHRGGWSDVGERGGTATYTATATLERRHEHDGDADMEHEPWDDQRRGAVHPADGDVEPVATVTATYGGRTSTMSVTIVDVPGAVPAAVKNLGITGPILSGTTMTWRLTWTPVTTFTNGTPLAPGRTVRYTVYWSDTSTLTVNSLRELSSGITEPALISIRSPGWRETGRRILSCGRSWIPEKNPTSAALEWVAANAGPKAPSGGFIKRKH